MKPKKLIIVMGDTHIYQDHELKLMEQIKREPYSFPTLKIVDRNQEKVEDFVLSDFIFENYKCYDTIKMQMAV